MTESTRVADDDPDDPHEPTAPATGRAGHEGVERPREAERYESARLAISAQAVRLYVRALDWSITSGWAGMIGRAQAELLASECGAVPEELVGAGFWIETDTAYIMRIGTLRTQ